MEECPTRGSARGVNERRIQAWVKPVAVRGHLLRTGVPRGYAWGLFGVLDPWPDEQGMSRTHQSCALLSRQRHAFPRN